MNTITLPTGEIYRPNKVILDEHKQCVSSGVLERDGVDEIATVIEWQREGLLQIYIKHEEMEEYCTK